MHWQEAVIESVVDRAVRVTEDGRKVLRYKSGVALIELHNGAGIRIARREEIEGYLDWKPDTPNLYL